MKRFNTWDLSQAGDFWTKKFKPNEIIRTAVHANSTLSHFLDARLISKYDITDVDTHTIGIVYTWVPITIDEEPTYLGEDNLFPWEYTFDENWIFIDAIYDKHIYDKRNEMTVNLQHDIDFIYKAGSGKVQFAKKLPTVTDEEGNKKVPPLYISKGWYSAYRIYNEIGHFLDYLDKDSKEYRDTIMPILSAFFDNPSYNHLLAILNIMIGLPVAKFGDETVESVVDGTIKTDKYTYYLGCVHTTLKKGDTLFRFQPLSDAVELNVHSHKPYWWLGHSVDVFAKYLPKTTISNELRDTIMEKYLYNSVAGVAFAQDRLGDYQIVLNKDIQKIFLKAAPSRSDFLFLQTYNVGTSYDTEQTMIAPHYDYALPRITTRSMYGRVSADIGDNAQFVVSSLKIPRPTIDSTYTEGKSLKFGEGIWHIFSSGYDSFNEFWRYYDGINSFKYKILVEPWLDRVYIRNTESTLPEGWYTSTEVYIPESLSEEHKGTIFLNYGEPNLDYVKVKDSGEFSDLGSSNLPQLIDVSPTYTAIEAYSFFDSISMNTWTLNNITFVTNGATVANEEGSTSKYQGYLISKGINTGKLPKNISATFESIQPTAGALIDIQYSFDKLNWYSIGKKEKINNVSGTIYFKFRLFDDTTTLNSKPILKSVQIEITLD